MTRLPTLRALAGLPTDYRSGAPWIRWQNPSYQRVMLPVE